MARLRDARVAGCSSYLVEIHRPAASASICPASNGACHTGDQLHEGTLPFLPLRLVLKIRSMASQRLSKRCPLRPTFMEPRTPRASPLPMLSERQDGSPFLDSISMYKVKELARVQRPERKTCNFKHNAPTPCGRYTY